MPPLPNAEELEDVLLACRYGDIDDVRAFVDKYGIEVLSNARDEQQNTVLHMTAANGHDGEFCPFQKSIHTRSTRSHTNGDFITYIDVLLYLLPLLPSSLSAAQNISQSTPLHWATVNKHLPTIKLLIEPPPPLSPFSSTGGPPPPSTAATPSSPSLSFKRTDLIDIKNAAGRTPLGEAELAEWDEGAAYLVSVMKITTNDEGKGTTELTEQVEEADEEIGPGEDVDIHVEVEDAEGKISKVSLKAEGESVSSSSAAMTSP